jgi:ATP/maltotriose-dependent transcriptional regulator MalT
MRSAYEELLNVDTAATAAADGRRWFALIGLHQLSIARGQPDSAVADIDRFAAKWKQGSSLFLRNAPVAPAFVARARQVAADEAAHFGSDYHGVPYTSRLWLLGVWAATDGQVQTAQAVASDLAARAASSGRRLDSLMAASMSAHVALARADTTEAISCFTALMHRAVPFDAVSWDPAASLGLERLTLGKLWIARGEFARAASLLETLESAQPASFPLYEPAALRLRADAAAARGDATRAATLRKRASGAGY